MSEDNQNRVVHAVQWRFDPITGGPLSAALVPLNQRRAAQTEREAHEPNAKLMELADRIDHEQLWRLSGLAQMDLPQEKQDRVLAGVMLRRYAELLDNDGWRIFPPRPGVSFRASTLDKVVEMARRDDARRASLPAPKQATPATPEDMKVYGGIAAGYFADTQQATPEPVPFSHAGHFYNLVGHALMEVKRPDACAHRLRLILDELAALMGQSATPEPVGEQIRRAEAIRLINALVEGDTLPPSSLAMLRELTRPAPGVHEGWRDAKNDPPPVGVDVLVAVEFDGPGDWRIKVGGRNPQERTGWCVFGASWVPQVWMSLDAHRAMLAAAQAKGGAA